MTVCFLAPSIATDCSYYLCIPHCTDNCCVETEGINSSLTEGGEYKNVTLQQPQTRTNSFYYSLLSHTLSIYYTPPLPHNLILVH